ncbi:protein LIFEGUARD 2-like [Magnolia sinica]|uniref:protein LIFEGUARD 2-like n=1 Tax=Magnolia sinica TaxID=86752 RepID=UPI00265AE634|nr:protein LIFEGUARD 2-like [Magnolia sinica]
MKETSSNGKTGDIEAGPQILYPDMKENCQLRWAFIRKVYAILTVQVLITLGVAYTVISVHHISNFFAHSKASIWVFFAIFFFSLIVLFPLRAYHQKHPWNFLLLALFTVSISFLVGVACSFSGGKAILEAVILTTVIVVSLTLYTFWAARRGHDFGFLGPFLFAGLMMLIVFSLIQVFVPLGKISTMIFGALAALLFCGYIVYDTDNLIKRYSYDEHIVAAISLYLDILNLFMALLQILNAD